GDVEEHVTGAAAGIQVVIQRDVERIRERAGEGELLGCAPTGRKGQMRLCAVQCHSTVNTVGRGREQLNLIQRKKSRAVHLIDVKQELVVVDPTEVHDGHFTQEQSSREGAA